MNNRNGGRRPMFGQLRILSLTKAAAVVAKKVARATFEDAVKACQQKALATVVGGSDSPVFLGAMMGLVEARLDASGDFQVVKFHAYDMALPKLDEEPGVYPRRLAFMETPPVGISGFWLRPALLEMAQLGHGGPVGFRLLRLVPGSHTSRHGTEPVMVVHRADMGQSFVCSPPPVQSHTFWNTRNLQRLSPALLEAFAIAERRGGGKLDIQLTKPLLDQIGDTAVVGQMAHDLMTLRDEAGFQPLNAFGAWLQQQAEAVAEAVKAKQDMQLDLAYPTPEDRKQPVSFWAFSSVEWAEMTERLSDEVRRTISDAAPEMLQSETARAFSTLLLEAASDKQKHQATMRALGVSVETPIASMLPAETVAALDKLHIRAEDETPEPQPESEPQPEVAPETEPSGLPAGSDIEYTPPVHTEVEPQPEPQSEEPAVAPISKAKTPKVKTPKVKAPKAKARKAAPRTENDLHREVLGIIGKDTVKHQVLTEFLVQAGEIAEGQTWADAAAANSEALMELVTTPNGLAGVLEARHAATGGDMAAEAQDAEVEQQAQA